MLKANQAALLQNTNNALLSIRSAELNYYTSFYLTFGGQAAIVGGFAYGSLTQIVFTKPDIEDYLYIQCAFWMSSAVCLSAAMHCILTTIFIQVFGPGLALHGPIGSMAKASIGMKAEVQHTFIAYIIMIVALAFNLLMSFWLLMNWESGLISSIILAFSMTFWWRYCSRIHNKFFIESIYSDTTREFNDDSTGDERDIPLTLLPRNENEITSNPIDCSDPLDSLE